MQGDLARILRVALPIGSVFFLYFQPAAVQIFFCTTSLINICQTQLIQNKYFRRYTGLMPMLPKAPTATLPTAPGGLKTWQDPADLVVKRDAQNVSVIDRFVDSAKQRQGKFVGGYNDMKETVWGKAEDKAASRKKEAMIKKAEAYEASRRREAAWERESRNRSKLTGAGGSNGQSSKGTVTELLDEDDTVVARTTKSKGGRKRR